MALNQTFIIIRSSSIFVLLAYIVACSQNIATADDLISATEDLGPQASDDNHYKIIWNGPYHKETPPPSDDSDNVIHISTTDNERYMCILEQDELNFDTSAKNSSSETQTKSPIELLEPLLKGNYCSYKFELFWIYELCHGKFLRQYHEENAKYKAKVTQEYYLGRAKADDIETQVEDYKGQTILVNGHYKPYVKFNMTDGTKCDLTKNNRVAKIIYVCNEEPSLELYSIKEISTCEYEAIVLSPHLCQHKDFNIQTSSNQEIQCYSLDGAPRRPKKTIDFEAIEEEDEQNKEGKGGHKRRVAYLQGRTLIIDADLLLS